MVGSVGQALGVPRDFPRTLVVLGVGCYDFRYFHIDWFPELLVSVVRAHGMDPRPAAQAQSHPWSRQGNYSRRALEPARR
jgi:hypothetical protein